MFRFSSTLKVKQIFLPACTVLTLLSLKCDDQIYVGFSFPGKEKELTRNSNGVEVTIRLSSQNPAENQLLIVNNSGHNLWLANRNVELTVDRTDIIIPVIGNYDSFIMKLNRKAAIGCKKNGNAYSCKDEIVNREQMYVGKGYSFGSIPAGESRSGNIVFNFPSPQSSTQNSEIFKKYLRRGQDSFRAHLTVSLKKGSLLEKFEFPVSLRVYDETGNVPLALRAFWEIP